MTPDALKDRQMRRWLAKLDQAPPVEWRQLCAIARDVFEPGLGDVEWSERVRARLVALGFQYESAPIRSAMDAVARAIRRPVSMPTRPFWSLRT